MWDYQAKHEFDLTFVAPYKDSFEPWTSYLEAYRADFQAFTQPGFDFGIDHLGCTDIGEFGIMRYELYPDNSTKIFEVVARFGCLPHSRDQYNFIYFRFFNETSEEAMDGDTEWGDYEMNDEAIEVQAEKSDQQANNNFFLS
jgi:hypothetical protein